MSTERDDIWKERKKEHEKEKSRQFCRTIANLGFITCWGMAIHAIWFLVSHEGWAQFYNPNQVPIEWTIFNTLMIQLIILSAVAVTILYGLFRLHLYRSS
ncbi:hypothetical protein EU537_11895 [Candidatus Thorarchaeota archaeon]|nr:MAG: hypothetical protein EU537_11895 [Candidatus Thorarchaeota archaeon]